MARGCVEPDAEHFFWPLRAQEEVKDGCETYQEFGKAEQWQRLGFCKSYTFKSCPMSAFMLISPLTESSTCSNIGCLFRWAYPWEGDQ